MASRLTLYSARKVAQSVSDDLINKVKVRVDISVVVI